MSVDYPHTALRTTQERMGGAQTGQMGLPEHANAEEAAMTPAAGATSPLTGLKEKLMEQPFTKACNSAGKFKAAREWLKENGGATVVRDALRADGFVDPDGDTLTLGVKPFNVFARMAGGAMPNPVDQSLLGTYAEEFMVCHNRPENDVDWEDESKAATASMAGPDPAEKGGLPGHVFISCRDVRWDRFNVLVMGMEGAPSRKDGADLKGEARALLQRLEAAGRTYATARGWDLDTTGMYFHVFPLNTVQSLHMHVVNLARKGPALKYHAHKNMPMSEVLNVFLP